MPVRKRKPTSPGRRFQTVSDFSEITRDKPERSLTKPKPRTGGGGIEIFTTTPVGVVVSDQHERPSVHEADRAGSSTLNDVPSPGSLRTAKGRSGSPLRSALPCPCGARTRR
jgi:hypothetical protein